VLWVRQSPTRIRTVAGWTLVVFGIAVAIFGFLSMGVYSPSLTQEEMNEIALVGGLILLGGCLMIFFGWRMLRADKKEKKGV
jgi:threonine/homoserine/homoserine lactone efflux protein